MSSERVNSHKYIFTTVLLFVVIFSLRMVHIGNSPAETGDFWRQPDTESIARNFLEQDKVTIFPQLNYDGPMPNYVQLEFQVTTLAIAFLYKIFGCHYFLARLVPLMFFMVSAWYLFLLARRRFTYAAAWMGTFVYSIFPIMLFYSRAVMPESSLLCFYVAAMYYFEKWLEEQRFQHIAISGLLMMLAISQKPPIAFVGLALLVLCIKKYGISIFRQSSLWFFAVVSLLPPLVYFAVAGALAETQFVTGVATRHIFPKALQSMLDPQAWKFFASAGQDSYSIFFAVCAFCGLVFAWKNKDWLVVGWAAAIFMEQLVINSVIRFAYYMDVIAPILALLVAYLVNRLIAFQVPESEPAESYCHESPHRRINEAAPGITAAVAAILAIVSAILVYQTQPRFEEIPPLMIQARVINEVARPGELVLIGSFEPSALSLSSRQGWRVNIHYYPEIPGAMEDEVAWYLEHGAKYMVITGREIYNDDEGVYFDYMDQHFYSIEKEGCTVFNLQKPRL